MSKFETGEGSATGDESGASESSTELIDTTSGAFALRLANLLVDTRTAKGQSLRSMASASRRRFSRGDLAAFESATRPLDETTIDDLVQLYGCDLDSILPARLPITVTDRFVATGGVRQAFDDIDAPRTDAVLIAYLTLVRSLRRQDKAPVVVVRRSDVEVLAGFLDLPDEAVVHRLASLMNVTQMKRTAMVGVLLTGAAVIGLVGSAVAFNGNSGSNDGSTATVGAPSSTVAVVTTTPTVPPSAPITVPVTTQVTTPVTVPANTVPTKPVTRITVPGSNTTVPPVTIPFVDTNLEPVDELFFVGVDEPPVPSLVP